MERFLSKISSDVYQSLIRNNPDSIFFLDVEGNVLDINSAAVATLGYSLDEYKEINYKNLVTSDQVGNVLQMFEKGLHGESCSYQAIVTNKKGQTLRLQVKNVPMLDKNNLIGVMIVAKDVTEFHQTRIALRETTERLRSLFDSTADAIDITDLNGNVLTVNSAFEDMYGWKINEIVGKPLPTIPKDLLNSAIDRRANAKAGIHAQGQEITCLKKDGTTIEASLTVSPIYDDRGHISAISGITRDITAKKNLERDLRESKERYKTLLNASPEPIFVHCRGVIRYINKSGSKLFGYKDPKNLLGRNILDFVHDDTKEIATARIRSINNVSFSKENIQQKMLRKDGSTFIVEGTVMAIEYEGEPAAQVILRDISEKKRVEEALIRSEERYRLIADNMTDLVAIINEEGVINYASPSSTNVLGFTYEHSKETSAFDFVCPEDLSNVLKTFSQVFSKKESIVIEFRVKHKTKGWIWIESKVSYFIDEEHGKPYLLFVAYSIGERKALQEKLKSMAFYDVLTGLPNRRLFQGKMEQVLTEAKRHNRTCALLYMDIDKFKWVNDQLGHLTGDELLIQFGKRVRNCLRESDVLARLGGDEFVVLLPEIENVDSARMCAERIIACLQQEWTIEEHKFKTTSSIGISIYPQDGVSMEDLLVNADRALYRSKESGRNTYHTYS